MALWNPESTITLYRVPWEISYNNVVDWDNVDRDTYFTSLPSYAVVSKSESAYMPLGMSITIDMPYEQARKYNYCVVENPAQPVDGDSGYKLYYFITNTVYPNPSATTLTCELDVWTTRITDIEFNAGYVVRSSCAMANSPLVNADNYALALNRYCSQTDGVATGDYYITFDTDTYTLDDTETESWVCIISTAELLNSTSGKTNAWGGVNSPKLETANGCKVDGVYSGCSVYFVKESYFTAFMYIVSTAPWIAQCIVSMYSIPSSLIDESKLKKGNIYRSESSVDLYYPDNSQSSPYVWESGELPTFKDASIDISKFKSDKRYNGITEKYRNIDKLNSYPYSVIEMNDALSGQSIFLKPELMGDTNVPLVYFACAVRPFLKCAVFPKYYNNFNKDEFTFTCNKGGEQVTKSMPYGELLNCAVWFDNFPTWSIVNNAYLAYMAGTANTRQYQYDNAQWTLDRSTLTANNTYNNSVLATTTSYQNAMIEKNRSQQEYEATIDQMNRQNTADILNYMPQAVTNTMGYAAVGLAGGGVAGIVGAGAGVAYGVAQGAANIDAMQGQLTQASSINATNQKAMLASANLNKSTGLTTATNNLNTAAKANAGDYAMQVQAIDASYADAALTQPSQSGNLGGDGFRYANGLSYLLTVRYKTINDDAIVRNGDYFYRFGYAVNRYMQIPDELVVNDYYSYWQIQQLETSSALMNEDEKNVIAGIFSNGVTVWKNPDDIGRIVPSQNKVDESKIATYYE